VWLFSANGATISYSLWAAPEDFMRHYSASAESAIHSMSIGCGSAKRLFGSRFQRSFGTGHKSWGCAPGCNDKAPLAPKRFEKDQLATINQTI
jgi:hypothetical protein